MLRVSVIIPAVNEQQSIAAAVQSARAAGADQVIVVDGGSQDDTVQQARAAGAEVLTTAAGRASQQNAGAAVADGQLLLFLHADCQLHPDSVAEIRQRLAARPAAVGGYFHQFIDHPDRRFRMIETGNLLRARLLKWVYGDQAIFVRTEVFRQLGGFPQLRLMEDLYLMKRLKRVGPLLEIRAKLTVSARRWQKRGILRQTLLNWSLITAAHLGISPDRLARFYPRNR